MSAVAHIDTYKTGKFFSDAFRGTMSWNGYEHNVLLKQVGRDPQGNPRFIDVAAALGADDMGDARGIALLDYDNDGDLDLAINHNPGDRGLAGAPAVLLQNEWGQRNNWIALELKGTRSNRDGVGTKVILESGDFRALRHRTAGSSYASQHSGRIYFGLGGRAHVDKLSIHWPSGLVESLTDLAANQIVRISEGEGGYERVSIELHEAPFSKPGGAR